MPALLDRLDRTVRSWSKVDEYLAQLERTPSDVLREQMAFTPFVFEDVGTLIDRSYDDLYLFSSDYPHFEGGRNPLGRFAASLEHHGEETRERFYATNFARVFGL